MRHKAWLAALASVLAVVTLDGCALALVPTVIAVGTGGSLGNGELGLEPDLPADVDLAQFYPKKEDFPAGWTTEVKTADTDTAKMLSGFAIMGINVQDLTEPKDCFPMDVIVLALSQSSLQAVSGGSSPGDIVSDAPGLSVVLARAGATADTADLVRTTRDRLQRCANFELKDPGLSPSTSTSTGQAASLKPVELPKARVRDAVGFTMVLSKSSSSATSGQENSEIVIAEVRGVLVLLSPPLGGGGDSAGAALYNTIYTKLVDRINAWKPQQK